MANGKCSQNQAEWRPTRMNVIPEGLGFLLRGGLRLIRLAEFLHEVRLMQQAAVHCLTEAGLRQEKLVPALAPVRK